MIYGIGADVVRVQRMARSLERWGERFASRILTTDEFEEFRDYGQQANYLAKRFAVKEAMAKAMGLGFQGGLQLKQIATSHDMHGKPLLQLTGFARQFVEQHGINNMHLSVTDEKEYAMAFVVLECND